MYSPQLFGLGIGLFILLYLIFIGGAFILFAYYYKTMIDVMSLVRPTNRQIGIGNVMFTVIPLFNLVYGFIVFPKICESIGKEYKQLGLPEDGDFGKNAGIAMQSLLAAMIIPILNVLAIIPFIILAIVFWVKIDGYKKKLELYNKNGFSDNETSEAVFSSPDTLD